MDIVQIFPNVLIFRSAQARKRLKLALHSTAIHQYRNWLSLQVIWLYIKFYHRLLPSFSLTTLSKVLSDLLATCALAANAVREILPWNMVVPFDTLVSLPQGFFTLVSLVQDIRNLVEKQQHTLSPIHAWGDGTKKHPEASVDDLEAQQTQSLRQISRGCELPTTSTSVPNLTLADVLILLLVCAYARNTVLPLHAIRTVVITDSKMSIQEWASVCLEAYLIATHALKGAYAGVPTQTSDIQGVGMETGIGVSTDSGTQPIGTCPGLWTSMRVGVGVGAAMKMGAGTAMSVGAGTGTDAIMSARRMGAGVRTDMGVDMDMGAGAGVGVGGRAGADVGVSVAILETISRKLWCPRTYRNSSGKTRDGIFAYACNSGNVHLVRKLLHARADVHRCIYGGGGSGNVDVLDGMAGEIHSGLSDVITSVITDVTTHSITRVSGDHATGSTSAGSDTGTGANTGLRRGPDNGTGSGNSTAPDIDNITCSVTGNNIVNIPVPVPAPVPVPVQVNTGTGIHRNNNNGNIRIQVRNSRTISEPGNTSKIKKNPVMFAMARNHVEVMKVLLEAQADVNGCDEEGETALTHAIKGEYSPDILSLLIKYRANVDIIDKERNTPLEIAMTKKNYRAFDLLVASGAKVNTKPGKWTLLMEAVVMEDLHIVNSLIQTKASLDARDSDGASALMLAAIDNPAIVSLLLEGKATIDAYDEAGFTPLMYAVEAGKDDIVHLLLDKRAKVDATGQDWTPLMIAAHYGCSGIAQILLDARASLERRNYEGRNALMMAASRGHHAAVRILGAQDMFYSAHAQ